MSFASLQPYGWDDRWATLFADDAPPGASPGRVARHDGSALLVATPDGTVHVVARVDDPPPVVGDWVVVHGDAVVAVLPRTSLLRRRDPAADVEQPVAANLDVLVVVCGLDRPLKPGRLQRAVTQSWDAGAAPVVVLSKADLADDVDAAVAAAHQAVPGLDVLAVSARDGTGVAALRHVVRDRTVALLGESGAGKSTIVNALLGREAAATGGVRAGDAKGRHTTTARSLHLLPEGGVLVDTPGVRAVGLWTDPEAVDAAFDDVVALADGCRFRDCAHGGEPGCAVAAAVDDGRLATERLAAWHALRREVEAAALRTDAVARRRASRRFGRMAREAQRMKGRPD